MGHGLLRAGSVPGLSLAFWFPSVVENLQKSSKIQACVSAQLCFPAPWGRCAGAWLGSPPGLSGTVLHAVVFLEK